MNKRKFLFSDRYKDILQNPDFAVGFSLGLSSALYDVMSDFDEPTLIQPDRYDKFTVTTSTSRVVYGVFFKRMGFPIDHVHDVNLEWLYKHEYWEWFDILELWADELSDHETAPFQAAINQVFVDYDQPWCIVEGRMIKIDAMQFEQDMQRKVILLFEQNSCDVPEFQNALQEYMKAIECYEKQEFIDCVLNAEKCYESTLKIVCGAETGTANELTRTYIATDIGAALPARVNPEGFRLNVLMVLPYIRNQLNVGHGEGGESTTISRPLARLSLNLVAALCTYVIEQYKEHQTVLTDAENEETEFPF